MNSIRRRYNLRVHSDGITIQFQLLITRRHPNFRCVELVNNAMRLLHVKHKPNLAQFIKLDSLTFIINTI